MSEVVVKRAAEINQFDSAKYKGIPKTFHLDEKNGIEQNLFILYVCV